MKKEAIALMLLLALAMMPIIAINTGSLTTASAHVPGNSYPTASSSLPVDWYPTTGYNDYQTLAWNPEFLQLETSGTTTITSDTTIILEGQDTYGANIEAKVFLPNGTGPEYYAPFVDPLSDQPVAFAKITGIYQQNATHNDQFFVETYPSPQYGPQLSYIQYLGQYHAATGAGWQPGVYTWQSITPYKQAQGHINGVYLHANGPGITATYQNVAPEPVNPEPLVVYINWHETDGDLYPESVQHGSSGQYGNETLGSGSSVAWLYIEGLDQNGNDVAVNVTIPAYSQYVDVPTISCAGYPFTFSAICNVYGNGGDSYYLFTNPMPLRTLFTYTTLIDHMDIYASSYDLLAYPYAINGLYPGVTNVTVTLVDQDGNLINGNPSEPIDVNFAATDGNIEPSCDVWITGTCYTTVNLTAETNAKTLNVTADADVPKCTIGSPGVTLSPELHLFTWTEMTFDGINSVFDSGPVVHELLWGYHTALVDPISLALTWLPAYSAPLPPEPPLAPQLGGPNPVETLGETYKFNGPLYEISIPLYVGCNLISSPVEPLMNYDPRAPWGYQYFSASVGGTGIPMSLLFNHTDSEDIEMIWWYCAGSWDYYIPSINYSNLANPVFNDGVGYWIMCDKPCGLEISGFNMQNAPFAPPGGLASGIYYALLPNEWSLIGVTTITGFSDYHDYLQSLYGGGTDLTTGAPIWVYYARYGVWVRNPPWGLWPGEAFWIYNAVDALQYIAP